MAQTHKIDIKEMKFNPPSVTIAKGDTVEWTNRMAMEHTVAPDKGEFPKQRCC
jgi:plastocyanin